MLPWILGGGGAAIALVLVIVAAVYLFNSGSRTVASDTTAPPSGSPLEPTPPPTPEATPPTTGPTSGAGTFPQPSGGRVADPRTGLSYFYPGDPWTVPKPSQVNPTDPNTQQWTSGYETISQKDFEPGKNWSGTVYAGPLANSARYDGPQGLRNALATFLVSMEPVYYEPPHQRRILADKAIKVSGKDAWLLEFEMDFSQQSKINHWKWKKERGALVLVDQGQGRRPSLLYASVPDNLDGTVLDKVLKSLQAS
jgi:hypothetical protein